jgi:hypothetical protein
MNKVLFKALEQEYWEVVGAISDSKDFADHEDNNWDDIHAFARHIQNLMHQK